MARHRERRRAGRADRDGRLPGPWRRGLARVISSPAQIDQVRDGEILVAPLTAPSWALIFGNIRATLTDIGGIMSHAAIVCREYGLPAVTGTASGTARIRTGQRIRVDGNTGTVTILDEDGECGRAALRGVGTSRTSSTTVAATGGTTRRSGPARSVWSHASPNGSGRWQQVHATRGDTQGLTR